MDNQHNYTKLGESNFRHNVMNKFQVVFNKHNSRTGRASKTANIREVQTLMIVY